MKIYNIEISLKMWHFLGLAEQVGRIIYKQITLAVWCNIRAG